MALLTSDKILKLIGRRHSSNDVKNVVKLAQNTNFENISLDFIYGLPEQTPQMFYKDLEIAINTGVQHISLYGLKSGEKRSLTSKEVKQLYNAAVNNGR